MASLKYIPAVAQESIHNNPHDTVLRILRKKVFTSGSHPLSILPG
jgi:hypothetical protein